MDRRRFLTRSGLVLGALVLGDDVLDAFARIAHVRKSFPSAGIVSYREEFEGVRIGYREEFEWAPGITVVDWRDIRRM